MKTHTIEVTDIDEELIQLLDTQIERQKIQDRSAYIRELLLKALKEEELTEFINDEIHSMRHERREKQAFGEISRQEAA